MHPYTVALLTVSLLRSSVAYSGHLGVALGNVNLDLAGP